MLRPYVVFGQPNGPLVNRTDLLTQRDRGPGVEIAPVVPERRSRGPREGVVVVVEFRFHPVGVDVEQVPGADRQFYLVKAIRDFGVDEGLPVVVLLVGEAGLGRREAAVVRGPAE